MSSTQPRERRSTRLLVWQRPLEQASPSPKRLNVALLLYAALAVFALAVVSFAVFRPVLVLPRIRLAPGFVYTDQTGQSINSDMLRGQLTFYTFTFAGCDDRPNCPVLTADIQRLVDHLATLPDSEVKTGVATILLNSEPVPAAQLPVSQTEEIDWIVLQGNELSKKFVVGEGFQVYYNDATIADAAAVGQPFAPRIILVDGLGMIRAEYRTATPDLAVVSRDIELLQREALSDSQLAKLGYEAAHLFVCYP